MPRHTRCIARLLVPFLVLLAQSLLVTTNGWAHTSLASSDPPADATVATVDRIVLTFSAAIEVFEDTVVLRGPDGTSTLPVTRSADGTDVVAAASAPLAAGSWEVSWRVLASDSHPREGTFAFTVAPPGRPASQEVPGAASSEPDGTATTADSATTASSEGGGSGRPWERAGSFARIVFYLGMMTAIGLSLFKAGPHRGQLAGALHLARWTAVAAAVALVASTVEVVLHVATVSGRGLAGAFEADVWGAVLRTGLGRALLLRSAGLTLLLVGGRRRSRTAIPSGPDLLKLVGAALGIGSFQFVGHTASASPAIVVRSADVVHAVAAAVWIGGLVGLAVVTRRESARTKAVTIGRFSSWATAAVIGVTLAGLALSVTNLPTVAAAWSTGYGRLLLAKLLVVGVLALLGAHNHFNVVPHINRGDEDAVVELRRTVSVEVVLAVLVVGLTALLVNTTPL